jgi:uncharacterized protein YbcC (UPF0753/DUF2309 family)
MFTKGHTINLGRKHSLEAKNKMSKIRLSNPTRYWKGKEFSKKHRERLSIMNSRPRLNTRGINNPLWKGGISKDKKHVNEQKKMSDLKRRIIKMNLISSFTLGEWELLKKQYGYICPSCYIKEPEIKLTIDHIIPLSKGGSNIIENIQPLCRSCNSRKHTKIIKYEMV